MKMMMLIAALLVFAYGRELTGISSSSNSYCYTCIDSNSTYWCAKKANSTSGYCCNSSESKSYCLGSDYQDYVCSNEDLPGRAENLLCPKETYDCRYTSDLVITSYNRSNNVATSIVSPGRTCEYRTYVNNTVSTTVFTSGASNSETYDVSINVDYVYYETYIGVYKYFIDSNSYELVREVQEYFTGYINTTMDSNTEIYVQMHPFDSLSCAGFTVYVNSTSSSSSNGNTNENTSEDDSGSSTIVTVIGVLVVFGIICGLCAFCCYAVYKKCFTTKRGSEPIPTTENGPIPSAESAPSPRVSTGVISGMPISRAQKRENMYYVNNDYEGNREANNRVAIDSQGYSKPQSQNAYINNGNPDAEVQNTQAIAGHIPVKK